MEVFHNFMRILSRKSTIPYGLITAVVCLVILALGIVLANRAYAASPDEIAKGERLITLHDNGRDRVILSKATTLRQAFREASIQIDPNDMVEPGLDETLVASYYDVNVYRARPVTVVDGTLRTKILSPYQTPEQIVKHAEINLQDEDVTIVSANNDMVSQGAGLQVTIDRATPFTFVLYGKRITAYTQGETVGEMLSQKDVRLEKDDMLSVPKSTLIVAGMTVELWREGKQTITEEAEMPFEIEKIQDADRALGYKEVKTLGVPGKRTVSYEIEMKNGIEISRKEIQSVTTKEPVKQVEVVGAKTSGNPLTKSKGVNYFTDSNGVSHRETYYDLPMSRVMQNCGAGGVYTVRSDGAKIDSDGHVIIAAHLANYPRCSIVETSLGSGKVYDTGGFTSVHPHGFDLATDWTKGDGI